MTPITPFEIFVNQGRLKCRITDLWQLKQRHVQWLGVHPTAVRLVHKNVRLRG